MENTHSYYNSYTEDQFAGDEHFREWVLYGETDKAAFWDNYLKTNPGRQQIILRARKKVEISLPRYVPEPLSDEEKLILKQSIFQRIGHPVRKFSVLRQKGLQLLKIAAVVSGITIVPLYFLSKQTKQNKQNKPQTFITERAGSKETREIRLPDSSDIILNANSTITYNSAINNVLNREITLAGNAYFKVKKKADHRSFTVHTGSLSIEVLGTEFNVDARSKATEIVLTTGKVKVSLDETKSTTIYMSPGEKVQLDTLHKAFIKSNTDTILYSAWTDGKWNFSSTSLLEITKLIHEYYGIETVFSNEKAKRLKLTAVIPVTDLSSFTNILAKTLDLTINEYQNQLHVHL